MSISKWKTGMFVALLAASTFGAEPPAGGAEPASPDAVAETAAEKSVGTEVLNKLQAAGKIGYLQVLLSVIALGVALESASRLRRNRVCPEALAKAAADLLKEGKTAEAERLCGADASVLGAVLAAAAKHAGFGLQEIQSAAAEVSGRRMDRLLSHAQPLPLIANFATMLGLLGTVIGMIGSFEAVALAGSMGDPSIMASQISYALVTTAIGLIVAVPCLLAHFLLKRKAAALASLLDETAGAVIDDWQLAARNRPHAED